MDTDVKRYLLCYNKDRRNSPMTFWVHMPMDGQPFYRSVAFDPPLPKAFPGKGYPYIYVEFDDFVFEFASLVEIDTCVGVLSQKNLPDTDKETDLHKTGPGSHWLNKLPGRVKSWRYRSKVVKYLRDVRDALSKDAAFA